MVIELLCNQEFDSKDVDSDLHRRMNKAVQDCRVKRFNMPEGSADGEQNLNFRCSELEDVFQQKIMQEWQQDSIMMLKGNQIYMFEMDLDKAGKTSVIGWLASRQMLEWHLSYEVNCMVCSK
jgi:hypothetical protein